MTQNEEVGKAIINLLNLGVDKEGKFKTSFGVKTVEGLGACIIRVLEEEANLYIE